MRVEKTPSQIHLFLTWSDEPHKIVLKEKIKLIPGWGFYPKSARAEAHYRFPLHSGRFVNQLLREYPEPTKRALMQAPEYVIGEIPPLPVLAPETETYLLSKLKRKPYPYQMEGIGAMLEWKRCINGDEPGLGKTTQAIAAAIAAGRKCILVICPASLKNNWKKEFEINAGLGSKTVIMANSVTRTWRLLHDVGGCVAFIVNYESLQKYFVSKIAERRDKDGKEVAWKLEDVTFNKDIEIFDCVIIDELHRLKDSSTNACKLVKGITTSVIQQQKAQGNEGYIFGLTGTMIVNKTYDAMAQLSIAGQLTTTFGGAKAFNARYCGGTGKDNTNLEELNFRLKSTCFFQRKKKDVLKDLPDKTRQIMTCEITTQKEYDRAMGDLASYLAKFKGKTAQEIDKSMMGEVMVKIGICKDISARGKIKAASEIIDDVVNSGQKIGVFVHQKSVIAELKKIYPNALTITGDDKMDERNTAVDKFQNDPNYPVIFLSIKAAGVGLTLTASSNCLFVELPWHSADCTQCEDRFHRIGQKDNVNAKYLLGAGTIDERIYEIIESKRDIAGRATGNTDGVQNELINYFLKK